ncbi:MAG: hypothetical protein KJZ47_02575 [Gemmatimonadales bacterium]|nr:hypothetical protein [Gemmatimonadales bacterium]
MIKGLFGAGTMTQALRAGLDENVATHRTIADRVARGLGRSTVTDFEGQLEASMSSADQELTQDMAALADTQLRYEAAARLLQRSYADLRTAIRDRG